MLPTPHLRLVCAAPKSLFPFGLGSQVPPVQHLLHLTSLQAPSSLPQGAADTALLPGSKPSLSAHVQRRAGREEGGLTSLRPWLQTRFLLSFKPRLGEVVPALGGVLCSPPALGIGVLPSHLSSL